MRIYRDSLGHWYASFVVPAQVQPLPATGRVIGIDWGVAELATTTGDTHDLPHPQHGRTAAATLGRYQRMMARRRPPRGHAASRGYRHAKRQAARLHKKIARQRQDTARKWAKKVVLDHDALASRTSDPGSWPAPRWPAKPLTRPSAPPKPNWWRCRKHERRLVLVDPKHTTTDCAERGARTTHALPLSEHIYTCTACGTTRPRDKNSAHVMLVRAGLNPG